jgi:diguanylate cyclase (GGDEF)-like protein/PAS domain S-box-containing protein
MATHDCRHAEGALYLLPWPIALIGRDGRIESINAACAQWLETDDGIGKPLSQVFHAHPALLNAAYAALAGQSPASVPMPSHNGQPEYRVFLKPFGDDNPGAAFYAEPAGGFPDPDAIQRRIVLDSALDKMVSAVFAKRDHQKILDRVVTTIVETGVGDSAAIYVRHDDNWVIRHACGFSEDLIGQELTLDQMWPSITAARENRVLILNDISATDDATRAWLERFHVTAAIDAKIDLPDGGLANVSIYHQAPSEKKFTDEDRIFLEHVTAGTSLALQVGSLVEALRSELAERNRIEKELRQSEGQLSGILANLPVAVFVQDTQLRLVRANERFEQMFGVSLENARGRTPDDFMLPAPGREIRKYSNEALESTAPLEFEGAIPWEDGTRRILGSVKSLRDDSGQPYAIAVTAIDITERKRIEEQVRHASQHDPLTGLPNRQLLSELLNLELAQARRSGKYVALLYLDLDRFKQINDELGHEAGDELLKLVALRMAERVRVSDVVARIGGDEFNVILTSLPSPERVSGILHDLLAVFAEPFAVLGNTLYVSTSIGISIFPADGDTPDILRRNADLAMYEAKRRGRNRYVFYNGDIETHFTRRLKIEHDLHGALERGEFQILLQPMVETAGWGLFSAEALVRWAHPQRGLLGPAEFLPLAEELGIITEIEEWVLARACEEAKRWNAVGGGGLLITVNLSARQFMRPDLADFIGKQIERIGIDPRRLQVEITEERAMEDIATALPQMQRLNETGVRLALDDFGTGYSSLNYLKRMPVSLLKIDKSFVRDITVNVHDRAVVEAVNAIGHSMHISVLAEGVESEEQLSLVEAAGCDFVQGFLVGAPMPPESMLAAMSARRWTMP